MIKKGENILDVLIQSEMVSSRNEARRLIKQNAVEFNEEKILNDKITIDKGGILKVGKKKFLKIVIR